MKTFYTIMNFLYNVLRLMDFVLKNLIVPVAKLSIKLVVLFVTAFVSNIK